MRTLAVLALLVTMLFASPALTSAQEDEEEGEEQGDDMDALMSGDPERPAKEPDAEEQAEDEEAPPGDELGQGADDERPPGDEPSAPEEPVAADPDADAASSGHPNPLSAALLLGMGFSVETGSNDVNPWGFGLGLRGGYNLNDFFLGARFVYHLGETVQVTRFGTTGNQRMEDVTANLLQFGVEAGYDIHAGSTVVLRPQFGIGFAVVSAERDQTSVFIAPGLSVLFEVSPKFFLGVEGQYQLVATEISISGIVALANIGMRF